MDIDSWDIIGGGDTAAVVRRSRDGLSHAKSATGGLVGELRGERDRLVWLASTDIPCPIVRDWAETGDSATLMTSTVPGIPAGRQSHRAVADMLAMFHALPIADCPFDRRLAVTVQFAEDNASNGDVDLGNLDGEHHGWSVEQLLAALRDGLPAALAVEAQNSVVCHGDPSLENVLINEDTGRLTGVVDLGRLGVADRHLDVAIAGLDGDALMVRFYRLLDEFF